MIAAWMAYGIAIGLLFHLAALAGERASELPRVPLRSVWTAAIVASVLAPFLLVWTAPAAPEALGSAGSASLPIESVLPPLASLGWLDPLLLSSWAVASVCLAIFLFRSARELSERARDWSSADVAGARVYVSRSTGPAVVGFAPPRLVVPRWVLGLDGDAQALLVEHERQHVRARDPLLLLLAMTALVLLPWSPGLWLEVRRLREAVEMDCDRRVARTSGQRRRYVALLLEVASRAGRVTPRAAIFGMASPPLERRIRLLVEGPRAPSPLAAAGYAVLLGVACGLVSILPAPPPPPLLSTSPSASPIAFQGEAGPLVPGVTDLRPMLLNRHEIPSILDRHYPDRLRAEGVAGAVLVAAFIGEAGTVAETNVVESSGYPELDEAARRAFTELEFRPARQAGINVGSWTEQPIAFLAGSGTASVGPPSPNLPYVPARLAIWSTPRPEIPPR